MDQQGQVTTTHQNQNAYFVGIVQIRDIITMLIIGAVAGAVIYGIHMMLLHWVFAPLMCGTESASTCSQSNLFASVAAQVIGGFGALLALIRIHAYRPLLIVLAVLVALWGVISIFATWPWWATLLGMAVVYGLAYGVFGLIAKLQSLVLAAVLTVILGIVVRLAIVL